MSTVMWVVVGLGVWMLVALVLALTVGRIVRMRDRQVPDPPPDRPSGPGRRTEPRDPRPPPAG